MDRPEYEISVDGDVTLAPASVDMTLVSHDVLVYKYLIGTLHRDMDVVEETFDEIEGQV